MSTNEAMIQAKNQEKTKHKITTSGIASLILFLIISIVTLIPLYANFIATFKPGRELVQNGLNLKIQPDIMSFDQWLYLFTGDHKYWMWFWNSLGLTILQVVCVLVVSAFVSYGFAAYEFKGKNFLFVCVLLTMMVPFEILMLPLYEEVIGLKLSNTWTAIILPSVANASTIFFFRQYLVGVPKEIADAGRVDGSSEYGIFFHLILPIMKPAFAAMAILQGMGSWNNLLWPLLVFRDANRFTLPIGLNTLLTPYGNNYDLLIVGAFFSMVPLFILYAAFQKFFVEGLTAGSVKG